MNPAPRLRSLLTQAETQTCICRWYSSVPPRTRLPIGRSGGSFIRKDRDVQEVGASSSASQSRKEVNEAAPPKKKTAKVYAVIGAPKEGVYESYAEARAAFEGVSGARWKAFYDRAHAEAFVNGEEIQYPKSSEAGTAVYIDGSSDVEEFRAGVGVHWSGAKGAADLAERLPGNASKQTIGRAELYALARALELDPHPNLRLDVYTDSLYVYNTFTKDTQAWYERSWKGSIENHDVIRYIFAMRKARRAPLQLHHVRSHDHNPGNDAADKLARAGSLLPEVKARDFADKIRNIEIKYGSPEEREKAVTRMAFLKERKERRTELRIREENKRTLNTLLWQEARRETKTFPELVERLEEMKKDGTKKARLAQIEAERTDFSERPDRPYDY